MFETFHFIRPLWLFFIPVITIIWWLSVQKKGRSSIWDHVCDPELVEVLLIDNEQDNPDLNKRNLFGLLGLLASFSLAGPAWEKQPDTLLRSNSALIITLDLSGSMLVHDVEPSRYVRARFKIEDLLKQHQTGDVALIAYAADAYAVTPLTHDVETLKALVPALSPKIMPGRGSNIEAALKLANELLLRSNLKRGDVLLITDGIGNSNVDELIRFSNESGLRLSVLGIGTENGAGIPTMNDIGFLSDENGGVIHSSLESELLSVLAEGTGGIYLQSRTDAEDINRLLAYLKRTDRQHRGTDEKGKEQWQDNGVWLLLLCLPLSALLFRKNVLFVFLLSCAFFPQDNLQAAGLSDLFKNTNQQARQAFNNNDFEISARMFTDMRWKAATAYRLNNWQQAYEFYSKLDDTESIYNRGNTLAFLSRLEEAVIAYNEVLRREPGHEDAAHNKAEILKLIESLSEKNKTGFAPDKDKKDKQGNQNESDQKDSKKSDDEQVAQAGEQKDSQQDSGNPDDMPIESAASRPSDTDNANTAEVSEVEHDLDEETLAEEQWLRRIKDDPAGLMRRKFREKYRQQGQGQHYSGDPW